MYITKVIWILLITTIAIKLNASCESKNSYCRKMCEPIPSIAHCPSYDFIDSNFGIEQISFFCQKYVHDICHPPSPLNSPIKYMGKDKLRKMNFKNINTSHGIALAVKKSIEMRRKKFCSNTFDVIKN